MTRVDQNQRAKKTWDILVLCAERQETISYGELAQVFQTHPMACRYFLELIQNSCATMGVPLLNSLVVSGKDQVPGQGFIGGTQTLLQTHSQVFNYDWKAIKNPFRSKDRRKIVQEQKDNFKEWMRFTPKGDGGKYSDNTINEYRSYINSMPNFIVHVTSDVIDDLFLIDDSEVASSFLRKFISDYEEPLKKYDSNKVTNFKSAFILYIEFLAETCPASLSSMEEILNDPTTPETEKSN